MPNHCSNILVVEGPRVGVNKFIKSVDTKKCHLDFNGVLPMPEELANTTAPPAIMTQTQIDKEWKEVVAKKKKDASLNSIYPCKSKVGITAEQSKSLIERFGTNSWYEWAVSNWGTKWGAYDASTWKHEATGEIVISSIGYMTAWSPATEFYINASRQFPKLTFTHKFAEGGNGILGYETIENGEMTSSFTCSWNNKAGFKLREELGCLDEA